MTDGLHFIFLKEDRVFLVKDMIYTLNYYKQNIPVYNCWKNLALLVCQTNNEKVPKVLKPRNKRSCSFNFGYFTVNVPS